HIAAHTSGINVGVYRLACFGLSGLYAGVAGSLYTILVSYINPGTFTLSQSIFILVQILIGGLGTLSGPIIGVVALVSLREYLLPLNEWQYIIYGAMITFIVLVARGGIVGGVLLLWRRFSPWRAPRHRALETGTDLVASDYHEDKKVGQR
ncbi:MAG TPA: branched-chain amino acid ABC transporter permease, partial [Ktedonobacteraceae bacterium]|nr:branched-chain amino acid ABC transporter permease [Ktedonobacteraceae bacterium]